MSMLSMQLKSKQSHMDSNRPARKLRPGLTPCRGEVDAIHDPNMSSLPYLTIASERQDSLMMSGVVCDHS